MICLALLHKLAAAYPLVIAGVLIANVIFITIKVSKWAQAALKRLPYPILRVFKWFQVIFKEGTSKFYLKWAQAAWPCGDVKADKATRALPDLSTKAFHQIEISSFWKSSYAICCCSVYLHWSEITPTSNSTGHQQVNISITFISGEHFKSGHCHFLAFVVSYCFQLPHIWVVWTSA